MNPESSRDRFLVEEMRRHLELVRVVAKAGRTRLESDVTSRYALEHAIELISEAAKHTSSAFQSANPEVPWGALRVARRVVAHPYDMGSEGVKVGRLWRFASEDAPKLSRQLRKAKFRV